MCWWWWVGQKRRQGLLARPQESRIIETAKHDEFLIPRLPTCSRASHLLYGDSGSASRDLDSPLEGLGFFLWASGDPFFASAHPTRLSSARLDSKPLSLITPPCLALPPTPHTQRSSVPSPLRSSLPRSPGWLRESAVPAFARGARSCPPPVSRPRSPLCMRCPAA